MRPIPIEDGMVAEGIYTQRVVMSAPNGDLLDDDIRPVECVRRYGELGVSYDIVLQCEGDDLANLNANGGRLVLTMVSGVIPFDVKVPDGT